MPTLRQWFEREYERLDGEGKSTLVDCFEAFNRAFFEGNYAAALDLIPDLTRLAEALGEPVWQVVVDYYAATASTYWRGDLGRGLEIATRAVVRAERLGAGRSIPALYAREALLYAWLETDSPGYAGDVSAALDEFPPDRLTPDLAARFSLVRAHCLAATRQGEAALSLALRSLPALEWPEAYQHNLRASALGWAGRHTEALEAYRAAIRAFDELGHSIERNGARLGQAEALLALGRADEALAVLEEVLNAAERSINRAHAGCAQGLTGRALLVSGDLEGAAAWFGAALETLDGLGWLRTEAEYGLARARALHGIASAEAQAAVEAAERRARRLRSGDLRQAVEELRRGNPY